MHSYGLMVALGFLVAVNLSAKRASILGLDPQRIQNLCLVALVGGIVGARGAYVLLNGELFRNYPLEILRIDHGGLVFYGGLIVGVAATLLALQRYQLPVWVTLDLMIPPLVLAQAIGRVGCFLNGCCYGKPTSVPWAGAFPQDGILRHPTQIYESLFLLALFFILKAMERRRVTPGTVILSYGLLYGVWRFGVEFLRGDNPVVAFGLTAFQWVSIPLALGCAAALFRLSLRIPKG